MTTLFAETGQTQAALEEERVEARSLPVTPASPADVRAAGWGVDDLWLPAVVCDASAVEHNLDLFAAWCRDRGVRHAPHGKTTMAPRLWAAQLARGAWAITAATVAQVRTMRSHGVPRVLLANEVTDPGELHWLAEASLDPSFDVCCLVDSEAGVAGLGEAVGRAQAARPELPTRPFDVLVELGVAGRRTGVREVADARRLAGTVAGHPHLCLRGVEGYEGVWPTLRDDRATADARAWLDRLVALTADCDADGLFADCDEVLVTAGGSAYADLVAEVCEQAPRVSRPLLPVVRSGCYVTHDHLSYERSSPLRSSAVDNPLRPALTCIARVLSCPEPGRSILGVGKRDVAFDLDLPLPLSARPAAHPDTSVPVEGRCTVVELNDHHAFCDHDAGLLAVGDVVELGLSHPCTVFDKWPLLPVVDRGRVVDALRTLF